jgi:thiamine-phosphate pyrophosphorylase
MSKKHKLELGFKLREITLKHNVLFIVNDDVDLAIILESDGVHLGQDDIPINYARPLMGDKIIGISTHSLEQAKEAVSSGADYIGIGPVFETSTKENRENLVGPELLLEIHKICRIPYIAIGGIGLNNVDAVIKAGCQRAAVISDILMAPDVEGRCRQLKSRLLIK